MVVIVLLNANTLGGQTPKFVSKHQWYKSVYIFRKKKYIITIKKKLTKIIKKKDIDGP